MPCSRVYSIVVFTAVFGCLGAGGCATVSEEPNPPTGKTETLVEEGTVDPVEMTEDPVPVIESEPVESPSAPEKVMEETRIKPGTWVPRHGDEIVVAGQFFRTGTPVVLWIDEAGYDGYRVERRYSPRSDSSWERSQAANPSLSSPNRYSLRNAVLSAREQEAMRAGNWSLDRLQEAVDQLVLHYDATGTSRACFEGLHDHRGLSIHFMVDLDGTIYQTLDLKEKAWHATMANSRSIGIEIANIGAYSSVEHPTLQAWYETTDDGATRLTIPRHAHPESVRNPDYSGRPDRAEPVTGKINGESFTQYDLTPEQYTSLAHLIAALHAVFPRLALDYPRDAAGQLRTDTLTASEWKSYCGVLGHYHIQRNKIDPGPALQWDRLLAESRALLGMMTRDSSGENETAADEPDLTPTATTSSTP